MMKKLPLNLSNPNIRSPQSRRKPFGIQPFQIIADEKEIERIINQKKRSHATDEVFLRLKPFQQAIITGPKIAEIIKKGTRSSDETFVPLKVVQEVISQEDIDKIIDEKTRTCSIDEMFVALKDFHDFIIAQPEIDKIVAETKLNSSNDETFVPIKDLQAQGALLEEQEKITPEEIERIRREKEATRDEPTRSIEPEKKPQHEPEEPKRKD